MLFYTPVFLIFSLILLGILGIVHKSEPRKLVLLSASYIFYMWWNPAFILLIIFSTAVDYVLGGRLAMEEKQSKRRLYMIASLVSNLGLLFFFKYAGLFSDSLLGGMRLLGYDPSWVSINITLPVGISFYTFQTMSYTIDIYRRNINSTNKPLDFALFVAFFPQLVAGPIVRAVEFLPQLKEDIRLSCSQQSFFLIMRGLAKKVLIADNLAIFIDPVFADLTSWPSLVIWIAGIAFAIQVYCDFSGYSDIAIGVARILGFSLPLNFNHPLHARNPAEFWRRWHISLSTWLRDYLYISLGGSRGSGIATYRNLMLTMILGGLWHGASWKLLLWGFLHGVILAGHRLYRGLRIRMNPSYRPSQGFVAHVGSMIAFHYCLIATFIVFRCLDFADVLIAMRKYVLFDFDFDISRLGLGGASFFSTLALMVVFIVMTIFSRRVGHIDNYLAKLSIVPAALVCLFAGFVFYYLWPLEQAPFIYFQF